MKRLSIFFRFLRYYFKARTWYRVHSPFVFAFAKEVLQDERVFYIFEDMEQWRRLLLCNHSVLELADYGAGPAVQSLRHRSVASVARCSACRPEACRWLFRIVRQRQPRTMLELGTSLGISAAYQAAAVPKARFVTIEGCPASANVARETFRRFGLAQLELWEGIFEEQLPAALRELDSLDYLFVDGNHRREPTLRYFHQCLAHAHSDSVFIFDDIHWSQEMEQAWAQIRTHEQVRISVDLFFFGVVFFRSGKPGQEHFTLIPSKWKPWAVGLGEYLGG